MARANQPTNVFTAGKARRSRSRLPVRHAPIILGLVVAACAPASSLSLPASASSDRWLTTRELETLLPGTRIVEADVRESYMRTPEEFHSNGSYVRHADNYEAHGKYSFRDNAVCDHALGEREVCRKILIDKKGQYWIISRDNPTNLTKITIEPLR